MLLKTVISRKLFNNVSIRNIRHSIYLKYSQYEKSGISLKTLLDNAASFDEKDPPSDQWLTTPYPINKRSQQTPRINVDPSSTSVILFPGQVFSIFYSMVWSYYSALFIRTLTLIFKLNKKYHKLVFFKMSDKHFANKKQQMQKMVKRLHPNIWCEFSPAKYGYS